MILFLSKWTLRLYSTIQTIIVLMAPTVLASAQTVPVEAQFIPNTAYQAKIHAIGYLHKDSEQKLAFKTSGYIAQRFVEAGERVESDQMLAALQLDEVQAQVDKTRSLVRRAKEDWLRAKRLKQQGVATEEQIDNAQTQWQVAQSELRIAEYNLKHSTLKAPSDGVVLRTLVEANELVNAGQPVLLFAPQQSPWVFRFGLTDRDVTYVKLGQSLSIQLSAWPDTLFLGRLERLSGAPSSTHQLYDAVASIEAKSDAWRTGYSGRVTLEGAQDQRWVGVPIESLVAVNHPYATLYRVLETGLEPLQVRVYDLQKDIAWVQAALGEGSQLQPGQAIVVKGARFIRPGADIEIHLDGQTKMIKEKSGGNSS